MSKYAPHRKTTNNPRGSSSTVCQKCLKSGHFIFECKSERPYVSRPSRTQQLENPRTLAKLKAAGKPSVEVPEELKDKSGLANKILEEKERERNKAADRGKSKASEDRPSKRRRSSRSSHDSSSDSDSSETDSDSGSDTSGSSSDSDSNSDSGSSRSGRRKHPPRRRSRSPSSDKD